MPATGSTRLGSLFLTLPTRALTGQQVIASDGHGARRGLSWRVSASCSPSQTGQVWGWPAALLRPARLASASARNRKFADSPLERNRFEIPVPGFRSSIFYTAPELGAAKGPAGLPCAEPGWPRQ